MTVPHEGSTTKQQARGTEEAKRECVYKGFYIYKDQYVRMLEITAQNKIKGVEPSSQSEMLREALDAYFDV